MRKDVVAGPSSLASVRRDLSCVLEGQGVELAGWVASLSQASIIWYAGMHVVQ